MEPKENWNPKVKGKKKGKYDFDVKDLSKGVGSGKCKMKLASKMKKHKY